MYFFFFKGADLLGMSGSNDLKLANHFYLVMTVYSWAIYKREARATFWFFCF
jgi:hypothetical protein